MQANPEQRALAVTNLESMERNSTKLLEREDARALLLPAQEVEPWLPALGRRWKSALDLLPQLPADTPPDAATTKALADAIWPAVGEMVQSIFTPQRIQQLTS